MGDVSLFARRGHGKSQDSQLGMNLALPATPTPALIIDALGRKCPIPIIMVAEQIRDVSIGEIIAVRADDPAAYSDIPSWCELKSHELAYREGLERGWEFGIRRRY